VRATWNIINTELSKKNKRESIQALTVNGTINSDPQFLVKIFNDHYSEVADSIYSKIKENEVVNSMKHYDHMTFMSKAFKRPFSKLVTTKTSSREIEKIINSLKSSCTQGYDEISNNLLKACKNFISVPLSYICNKMLFEGAFPERLKYATVVPVYKKGDRKMVTNYRPISILTSISKIFEKVIYNRLSKHLNDNLILSSKQFGFRKNHGTDNAIYSLIFEILKAFNQKRCISGLFCDLEKAFDCVNHDILLQKLKYYGIEDKFHNLLGSYLFNRKQRTTLVGPNNVKVYSEWINIEHGVPQGSILGPLLFSIFINDLPIYLKDVSLPILFADDTSIIISRENTEQLSCDMDKIYLILDCWFKKNQLSLNLTKTNYIDFIVNAQVPTGIKNLNSNLTGTKYNKFLGLTIQYDLEWNKHIEEICKKLNLAIFMIRNIKPLVSIDTMKIIYHAYFHSIMAYGIMFWGNSTHVGRVFKLQKKVIRCIAGCNSCESCREYFREMRILPLKSQYIYSMMKFAVKNNEIFDRNNDYHNIETRQCNNMHVTQVNLTKYGKGVHHMIVKIFNRLPAGIKAITNNPKIFKIKMKEFLLTKIFYTLDEYLIN
jgi:hypothetical protein